MADDDAGEKSLDPTPHRRQQAREEGQVVQSQDLTSAGLLLTGLVVLLWSGKGLADYFAGLMHQYLGGDAWLTADAPFLMAQAQGNLSMLGRALFPVMGMLLLAAVLLNLGQIGILFLPNKVMPDFSRLDPLSGIKRLFSLQNVIRLAFGILKIAIVSVIAYRSVLQRRDDIMNLVGMDLAAAALLIWEICLWTCLKVGCALAVLAILDYGWQRWKHEKDLRMTPQEMREEMRNLQGDPQILARRRQAQRQAAMNRVNKSVPTADVVITNPTELAIAIQYDALTMAAPIVVAKGAGVLAQRIRKLALENGVPIVERKPLAQALYKDVDVGKPIPGNLYAGVAEILAYVYQLKGKPMPTAN